MMFSDLLKYFKVTSKTGVGIVFGSAGRMFCNFDSMMFSCSQSVCTIPTKIIEGLLGEAWTSDGSNKWGVNISSTLEIIEIKVFRHLQGQQITLLVRIKENICTELQEIAVF